MATGAIILRRQPVPAMFRPATRRARNATPIHPVTGQGSAWADTAATWTKYQLVPRASRAAAETAEAIFIHQLRPRRSRRSSAAAAAADPTLTGTTPVSRSNPERVFIP
ncbi:hypothetical protein ABIB17_001917 [Arthrobacter sp. UYEF6]